MSGGSSYLVKDLPYGFCPGCSHGLVVDALGAALEQLSPERSKVALVSDIGCVGLVDKHFNLNTVHGLHGRSITYATGLKLVRPELMVIVVIGDGGCGIGGHHLIQAARRGVPMTVVVFNNFNYGMTGGEHSATTPLGAVTSSTPGGNTEAPLDLCALAMAAGASFVARVPAFDKDLAKVLTKAAQHSGFALIDVWELCTAYFMPNNDFKKQQLLALSETNQMPFGVLRDEARSRHQPAPSTMPSRIDLAPAFSAQLSRPVSLIIAGSAGQKVKTAATLLGSAAIRAGLYATQKDDYPITVKTGHSVSEVKISPTPIRFTGITTADIAVVLTADGLNRTRKLLEQMPGSAVIFLDKTFSEVKTSARLVPLDFTFAAKVVGRENVALWAISAILPQLENFPPEAFKDTVSRLTPAKYREVALRAVDSGAEVTVSE